MEPILYQWRLSRENPFAVDEQTIPPDFENPVCDMHAAVHLGILLRGTLGRLSRPCDLYFTASWQPHGNIRSPGGAEMLLVTVSPEALLECLIDAREEMKKLLFLPAPGGPEIFRTPELRERLRAFCVRYSELKRLPDPGTVRQQLWLEIVSLFHAVAKQVGARYGGAVRDRWERLRPAFSALAACRPMPLTVPEAARLCRMSESHFAHLFRACTGISFAKYELAFRLNGAAAELRRGGVGLKQLAAGWGFYDVSHFSRSYKRHFGVPPSRDRGR